MYLTASSMVSWCLSFAILCPLTRPHSLSHAAPERSGGVDGRPVRLEAHGVRWLYEPVAHGVVRVALEAEQRAELLGVDVEHRVLAVAAELLGYPVPAHVPPVVWGDRHACGRLLGEHQAFVVHGYVVVGPHSESAGRL